MKSNPYDRPEFDEYCWLDAADLPEPQPQFDLARLLGRNGEAEPQPLFSAFETEEWCRTEDIRRAKAAENFDWEEWPLIFGLDDVPAYFASMLGELASPSSDSPYTSPASAICMRKFRRKFCGMVLEFLSNQHAVNKEWVTLSPNIPRYSKDDKYWDAWHFGASRFLRAALRMAGVTTAPGFLIGYIHAVMDTELGQEGFTIQLRGICGGEKLTHFRRSQDSISNPANRPMVCDFISRFFKVQTTTHRIGDLVSELPRLMPNHVQSFVQLRHGVREVVQVPEELQIGYLVWRELHRESPLVIFSGVRPKDQRLVPVDEA